MKLIENLTEKQCYIIDFLPEKVSADCGGQFFSVEEFLLKDKKYGLTEKFIRVILKIMCYYPVKLITDGCEKEPTPDYICKITEKVMNERSGDIYLLLKNDETLINIKGDCLYISVFNPDDAMISLFEKLALSEGLFFRLSTKYN